MNNILKRTFVTGLVTTGLVGGALLPMKPAAADKHMVRDLGIGAATGAVTGVITGHSPLAGAANGAAAGAAVSGANSAFGTHPGHRDLPRDAAVGTAAGLGAGLLTGRHRPLKMRSMVRLRVLPSTLLPAKATEPSSRNMIY